MDFDDLQKAWKSQDTATPLTINANLLFNEVRRNHQQFWATIFWRDVREVGVAFLLVWFFVYRGMKHHDWTDDLSALACFGVGMFMVIDRVMQWRGRPVPMDSLKGCVEASLVQVEHQIWLLKNVFWWYLLPLVVTFGISVFCSHRHVHLADGIISALIGAAIFYGVYRLNQLAVRTSLKPRQKELEDLLASLQ